MLRTCWQHGCGEEYAPLAGETSADVIVVGGGLMGLAVAYWLSRSGGDVVLLEADHLSAGSTGRNAGLMLHGVSALEDPMWVRELEQVEGLDLEYAVHGHLSLADSPVVWEAFQQEVRRRPSWAPPLQALEHDACEDLLGLRIDRRFPGGRWYPAGAVIHSSRFVGEIARAATRHGARIHTGTPAVRVEGTSAGVVVTTTGGTVSASAVVHATAAATRLLPELSPVLRALRVQVLSTTPVPAVFSIGLGVNWGDLFGRQLSDGRFVLGGGGGAAMNGTTDSWESVDAEVQHRLQRFLAQTFPDFPTFTVQHRWAGVLDCTPDHKPIVGAHPTRPREWLCMGFNGHGMPRALGVGHALATAIGTGAAPAVLEQWAPARFELRPAG